MDDDIAEIKWSLSTNTPTITTTEEHLPETTPFISLKTGKKKIPKSIEQPPSISISQSNSVTENVTSVSTDKRVEVHTFLFSWNFLHHISSYALLSLSPFRNCTLDEIEYYNSNALKVILKIWAIKLLSSRIYTMYDLTGHGT